MTDKTLNIGPSVLIVESAFDMGGLLLNLNAPRTAEEGHLWFNTTDRWLYKFESGDWMRKRHIPHEPDLDELRELAATV